MGKLVKELGISACARQLGITPQALSSRLRVIERGVGMPAWEPIKCTGKPKAVDSNEQTQRVALMFPLSSEPPREWRQRVTQGITTSAVDANPRVEGESITLWSRKSKEEFDDWIKRVAQVIDEANADYQEALGAEQDRRDAKAEGKTRRQAELDDINRQIADD